MSINKKAQVKPYNKMLLDNRSKLDTKANDDTGNLEWLLNSYRKDIEGDIITEKQLENPPRQVDSSRKASVGGSIIEKMLNDATGGLNKTRDQGIPLQDMTKTYEKAFTEAYKKGDDPGFKTKDDRFSVKPGSQMIGPSSNKVSVDGRKGESQLLSNYDSREDMDKANPSIKKAEIINNLKIADALTYHIYRTAATKGIEVSKQEKDKLELIALEKTFFLKKLSQSKLEIQEEEEERAEKAQLAADKIEEELEEKKSLSKK